MNLKFRKKPVEVEAFQMTAKHRTDIIDWPEWLREAWALDVGVPGSLCPTTNGVTPGVDLLLWTGEGDITVSIDDWLVLEKGAIRVYSPDVFAEDHEAVPQ